MDEEFYVNQSHVRSIRGEMQNLRVATPCLFKEAWYGSSLTSTPLLMLLQAFNVMHQHKKAKVVEDGRPKC